MINVVYYLTIYYFLISHYYTIILMPDYQLFSVFLKEILSYLFVIVSELLCGEIFENYLILFAILLPIKSPVAATACWYSIIILYYILLYYIILDYIIV